MARITPYAGARAAEAFRQRTVERFTNLQRQAIDHVCGRNQGVAELLGWLSLMRNAGLIPEGARLEGAGARFQTLRGIRAAATEGAHCLPAQLEVIGLAAPIETLLPNRTARERFQALFGHVTDLPRSFNRADTAAERVDGGLLVNALVSAGQRVIELPRAGEAPRSIVQRGIGLAHGELSYVERWPISVEGVRQAYHDVWVPRAAMAYQRALDAVRLRGAFLSAEDDAEEVAEIMTLYLRHHGIEPSRLMDAQLAETVERFHDEQGNLAAGASP